MWARRSRKLLQACMLPKGSSCAAEAAAATVHQPTQYLPTFAPLTVARGYTTGFWDVPQSARHELYIELHTIRNMLPNRNSFVPQFTPHGVMLMPNSSIMQQSAAVAQQEQAVDDEAEQKLDGAELWADSVRRKRKLKMKKHKYKKRQKKLRHQT